MTISISKKIFKTRASALSFHMKKRWSQEDTQYLIDNYTGDKDNIKALIDRLRRTEDGIRLKAVSLGLTQKESYWSGKESTLLIKNREHLTYSELARLIGRTVPAIAHHIQELKKKGIIHG